MQRKRQSNNLAKRMRLVWKRYRGDSEPSFSSENDFRGSQGYTAEEVNDCDVINMEYFSRQPDHQNWDYNLNVDYLELFGTGGHLFRCRILTRGKLQAGKNRRFR